MKTLLALLLACAAMTQSLCAQQFTPPPLPPGAKSGAESVDAEVVKVYSLDDQGATYRAYAIKYKGSEVIATDTMGTSNYKVGDKIKVIVARVEVPLPSGKIKSIAFSILPTAPKK